MRSRGQKCDFMKVKRKREIIALKKKEMIFEKYRVKIFANSFSKSRLRAVDLSCVCELVFELVSGGCATVFTVRSILSGNDLFSYPSHMSQRDSLGWPSPGRVPTLTFS